MHSPWSLIRNQVDPYQWVGVAPRLIVDSGVHVIASVHTARGRQTAFEQQLATVTIKSSRGHDCQQAGHIPFAAIGMLLSIPTGGSWWST
jgi:hypothetical protein